MAKKYVKSIDNKHYKIKREVDYTEELAIIDDRLAGLNDAEKEEIDAVKARYGQEKIRLEEERDELIA